MPKHQIRPQKTKILAIDPGTREMGVAYLEDRELVDYGVKTLRPNGSRQELFILLDHYLRRLIAEKKPDVIVLEKNQFSQIRSNILLAMVIARIIAIAKTRKVLVREFNPRTVRKAVCNNGNATKRDLARAIALSYPELKIYLASDKKWKLRYWQNIFDAIAVGLAYMKGKEKTDRLAGPEDNIS